MTEYQFKTRVLKIEKKKRAVRARKISDDNIDVEYEDLGWYVLLEGAVISIAIGSEKPDLLEGQNVMLVIRPEG